MHVAYVLEPPYPTFFVSEVEAVRASGLSVSVLNSFRPLHQPDEAAERLGCTSFYFPDRYQGVAREVAVWAARRPKAWARLVSFLARHRLPVRLLALSAHYAALVERHGIDHLHAGYGTTPATIAMLASWLCDRPYSFTLHAYDLFLRNPLLVEKAEGARFITTISDFNRRHLEAAYPGRYHDRVKVVRLGVDLGLFPMREPQRAASPAVCVSVARLTAFKGHDVLIKAFALARAQGLQMDLVFVGDGELKETLHSQATELGIEGHVTFAGHLQPPDVRACLAGADLFALAAVVTPDGQRDGIPVALMEAMASGVPVVSSRVAGIPELVMNEETGLLAEPGDVEGLASRLCRLTKDEALRQRLGCAARKHVESYFDLRKSAARMKELFEAS